MLLKILWLIPIDKIESALVLVSLTHLAKVMVRDDAIKQHVKKHKIFLQLSNESIRKGD
jgi:hypothetical protein